MYLDHTHTLIFLSATLRGSRYNGGEPPQRAALPLRDKNNAVHLPENRCKFKMLKRHYIKGT
jgi:hypothetical protein